MSLHFFADHCVSKSIIDALTSKGNHVRIPRDHLPQESPDALVIEKAQELNAILVSLNGDFADILTYPPDKYCGIISLQVRNHPEVTERIIARLLDYLDHHPESDHYEGKLLLVEAHRIRVWA